MWMSAWGTEKKSQNHANQSTKDLYSSIHWMDVDQTIIQINLIMKKPTSNSNEHSQQWFEINEVEKKIFKTMSKICL